MDHARDNRPGGGGDGEAGSAAGGLPVVLREGTGAAPSPYRVCLVALAVTLGLFALKNLLAVASGSASLRADSLHSFSDFLTTLVVLVGFLAQDLGRRWRRIPPRVLAAIGPVTQITVLSLVVVYAWTMFVSMRLAPVRVTAHAPALVGAFVSMVVAHYLWRYKARAAAALDSAALRADALESRVDQLSSALVFLSVALDLAGLAFESTAAVLILAFTVFHALDQAVATGHAFVTGAPRGLLGLTAGALTRLRRWWSLPRGMAGGLSRLGGRSWSLPPRQLRRVGLAALAAAAVAWAATGVYTLKPGQVAVVTRFGRHLPGRGTMPGLHLRLPWPVDRVTIVDLESIRQVSMAAPGGQAREYLVTRDDNLVDAAVTLQYRIADAAAWVTGATDMEPLLEDLLVATVSTLVGGEDIDQTLLTGKESILESIRQGIQARADSLGLGIRVVGARFDVATPPAEVLSAFTEVASAREDQRTTIDQAHTRATELLASARGEGSRLEAAAAGSRLRQIGTAKGLASRLAAVRAAVRTSPGVALDALYFEMLEKVAGQARVIGLAADSRSRLRLAITERPRPSAASP